MFVLPRGEAAGVINILATSNAQPSAGIIAFHLHRILCATGELTQVLPCFARLQASAIRLRANALIAALMEAENTRHVSRIPCAEDQQAVQGTTCVRARA